MVRHVFDRQDPEMQPHTCSGALHRLPCLIVRLQRPLLGRSRAAGEAVQAAHAWGWTALQRPRRTWLGDPGYRLWEARAGHAQQQSPACQLPDCRRPCADQQWLLVLLALALGSFLACAHCSLAGPNICYSSLWLKLCLLQQSAQHKPLGTGSTDKHWSQLLMPSASTALYRCLMIACLELQNGHTASLLALPVRSSRTSHSNFTLVSQLSLAVTQTKPANKARLVATMEPVQADDGVVAVALDRVCYLESRLRQAMQQVVPLTDSLGGELVSGEREVSALVSVLYASYLLTSAQVVPLTDSLGGELVSGEREVTALASVLYASCMLTSALAQTAGPDCWPVLNAQNLQAAAGAA